MADDELAVLLIEDNPGDIRLVREALADMRLARWRLTSRETLFEGLELLRAQTFDVVLLDLTLPDCSGGDTIARVHRETPLMPIVVLTGTDNEAISREAVRKGAQDFLVKGMFEGGLLARSLFYAVERARLRQDLEKARDEALQAAKLKSEFLAIISHEMRTPMNAIVGPLELLIDTAADPDQIELARTALAGSTSMLSLIDDVIDYSRLAGGALLLREIPFDPAQTLAATIGDFRQAAEEKCLQLAMHNTMTRPILVAGDPARLGQVLINLISNAIKFTHRGEVAVNLRCDGESATDVTLRVEVADTGIGITREVERKLFAPFSQADSSSTRKFGGTGLGLAIAKQLVERMDGSIGVTSTPGSGSTFYFTARMRKAPTSIVAGYADNRLEAARRRSPTESGE